MAKLEIEVVPVLSDNYCYLLHEPRADVTGAVDVSDAGPILARLKERGGRKLDWVLITHEHGDHVAGVQELKAATGCRVVGPRAAAAKVPGLDVPVGEGDRFSLGEAEARVFEAPGHAPGHIVYWFEDARALFCGDVLFALGCGRVFGGDFAQMWRSLAKLLPLPDDARVYCGHEYTLANARFALSVDPDNPKLRERAAEVERLHAAGKPTIPSTMGLERATNPFLRVRDPSIRARLGLKDAGDAEVFAELRRRKDAF
ncbi:MAG TPA: hydroxyacylglutathione hydrolase [Geminicoccaceae bacterium]|nr:hydroxyacylglutathione hydrolase [Geminicoccaceae bacterium]